MIVFPTSEDVARFTAPDDTATTARAVDSQGEIGRARSISPDAQEVVEGLPVTGLAPEENSGRCGMDQDQVDWLPPGATPEILPAVHATPVTAQASARPPSVEELAEQRRRLDILERIEAFREANPGVGAAEPCRQACISQATYSRWRTAYLEQGADGLLPRTSNSGRRPKFAGFEPEAQQKLVQLYMRTGSQALALQLFRDDPLCPEPLRVWIDELNSGERSRHRIPPSLRKLMHQTPAVHDKFRGPRRYELNAVTTLRSMSELDERGLPRDIEPGDWWEMDDMSVNLPFWYESPFGSDRLAERHGVGIGRQSLCAMDIASGKWLGFDLIGRPRDAYKAEDILRFLRRLFTEYGLPRRGLRLEQGVWKSKRLTGYTISETGAAELENTRPGMPEEEQQKISGGIESLGIEVQYVFTPKAKGFIESGFNFLQSVMAAIANK